MTVSFINTDEKTRVTIDGELTIYNAIESRLRLLAALDASTQLEVNTSAVSEIDTAGVQLLLMLHREAMRRGKSVRFTNINPIVQGVIHLINSTQMTDSAGEAA